MRSGGNLFHSIPTTKMTTAEATTTAKTTFSPPATIQRSPWHSPVPYLFGGLAAMLGLIAFALLILACSYWKLSTGDEGRDDDVESGAAAAEKGDSSSAVKALPVFEEKFLVIMAGEVKPTFLATPMCSRNTSFDDEKVENKEKLNEEEDDEKMKKDDENALGNEAADHSHLSQEQNQLSSLS